MCLFFQAEDGIRDLVRSRGLGDVYKRQDKVRAHVPLTVPLTVTAAPGKGLGATFDLATALADSGYRVVPHVAARMVSGRDELVDLSLIHISEPTRPY